MWFEFYGFYIRQSSYFMINVNIISANKKDLDIA